MLKIRIEIECHNEEGIKDAKDCLSLIINSLQADLVEEQFGNGGSSEEIDENGSIFVEIIPN